MTNAYDRVRQIAESKGVSVESMFFALLHQLWQHHKLHQIDGADASQAGRMSADRTWLEVLRDSARLEWLAAKHNSETGAARVFEALCLALGDCMNDAEKAGLSSSIFMDETMQDWPKLKPRDDDDESGKIKNPGQ